MSASARLVSIAKQMEQRGIPLLGRDPINVEVPAITVEPFTPNSVGLFNAKRRTHSDPPMKAFEIQKLK